jgi:hypothetical protein
MCAIRACLACKCSVCVRESKRAGSELKQGRVPNDAIRSVEAPVECEFAAMARPATIAKTLIYHVRSAENSRRKSGAPGRKLTPHAGAESGWTGHAISGAVNSIIDFDFSSNAIGRGKIGGLSSKCRRDRQYLRNLASPAPSSEDVRKGRLGSRQTRRFVLLPSRRRSRETSRFDQDGTSAFFRTPGLDAPHTDGDSGRGLRWGAAHLRPD